MRITTTSSSPPRSCAAGSAANAARRRDALDRARSHGRACKLHKFKRIDELPRVRRVIGMLRGALRPTSLLDVGSGRGAFLWPLLDAFPRSRSPRSICDERRAARSRRGAAGAASRGSRRRAWTRTRWRSPTTRSTWSRCSRCWSTCDDPARAAARGGAGGAPLRRRVRAVARGRQPRAHPAVRRRRRSTALFNDAGARRVQRRARAQPHGRASRDGVTP